MGPTEIEPLPAAPLAPQPPSADTLALMATLPDMREPLHLLMTFLPDVRLKQRVSAAAEAALAVDVADREKGGLALADKRLTELKDALKACDGCFEFPVSTAYALHRRLTGLLRDFRATGDAAAKTVGDRIYRETKRLEQLEAEDRRRRQAEEDQRARETAARAATEATRRGAPADLVDALKKQAETATAPPVMAAAPASALRNSTVVEKWKARLAGTLPEAEPNVCTADMSPAEQEQMLRLVRAVGQGLVPLSFLEINWTVANARANSDRKTFDVPGLAAFDAGGLRQKARR